jgi:nitric oxide reductase subunit B
MVTRSFDSANLSAPRRLAVKYFIVAMALFAAQLLFGLLASLQFLYPELLYGVLDFSVNRTVHIDAMVVWLLFGFVGSIYWLLEDEARASMVGVGLANLGFWVVTVAVAVVVLVFLLVQTGPGTDFTRWFVMEGREYIEAPRWADIGIVAWGLIFAYNVVGTFIRGRWTGIGVVLALNLVALLGLYLAGMYYMTNISHDQFWWWWVIHLWVEATWEVLVGVILAWALMHLLGVRRLIVTGWLFVEVALMLGFGILGLGHHYFWTGPPEYWFGIGAFFSALEPVPLVAMVVHAIYDSAEHGMRNRNHPAMAWAITHTFGNFIGAGVWGFMQTLPQINLWTHGTQWTASHGHLSFFGAYVTINLMMIYIAVQKWRGDVYMGVIGARWKWALGLLTVGMLGMSVALIIAGYQQSFIERAIGGSTWSAYFEAQADPAFVTAMWWRLIMGFVVLAGYIVLIWDLLVVGRHEERTATEVPREEREFALRPAPEAQPSAG